MKIGNNKDRKLPNMNKKRPSKNPNGAGGAKGNKQGQKNNNAVNRNRNNRNSRNSRNNTYNTNSTNNYSQDPNNEYDDGYGEYDDGYGSEEGEYDDEGDTEQSSRESSSRESLSNNQSSETTEENDPFSDLKEKAKGALKSLPLAVKVKIALIAAAVGLVILIIIMVIMLIQSLSSDSVVISEAAGNNVEVSGVYNVDCTEVNVIATHENGKDRPGGTYSLEDYVAGVVNAEVGIMNDIEVYKAFAIAARTFFVANNNNCSIKNSTSAQTFEPVAKETDVGKKIIEAVNTTKGQVILDEDGDPINAQYDAFCTTKVTDKYYILKQNEQEVPIEWADKQGNNIADDWKLGREIECHGNGMSQWGAYYLTDEEGFLYTGLINYYYNNDPDNPITLSGSASLTEINGIEITSTADVNQIINQPIDDYLKSKGSSLDTYNNYIKTNVTEVGAGTRNGVVMAAVAAIKYLYDNYRVSIAYYWNGFSQEIGIPATIGENTPSDRSRNNRVYEYVGFDCSGFVSWAIRNGGYNFTRHTSATFEDEFDSNSCDVTSDNCQGQPGDIIHIPGHVKLIVGVDTVNDQYYVAEAVDSGVIIRTQGIHSSDNTDEQVLHMDSFYSNSSNIDRNY